MLTHAAGSGVPDWRISRGLLGLASSPVHARDLQALIPDIYEAALDPGRFEALFRDVCQGVGVAAAGMKIEGSQGGAVEQFWYGLPAAFERDFVAEYWKEDPWTDGSRQFPIGRVLTSQEMVDDRRLAQTRFYNDLCLPHGLRDAVGGCVGRTAETYVTFGMMRERGAGGSGAREARLTAPLMPHFAAAARVLLKLKQTQAERDTLSDALDTLPLATLVVSPSGHLRHANAKGRALLRSEQGLFTRAGMLTAAHPQTRRELERALATRAVGALISIPEAAHGQTPWVLLVAPTPQPLRHALPLLQDDALVLYVFESSVGPPGPRALGALQQLFRLTGAEGRVLGLLLEGLSPAEIAAALSVEITTVRTQLRALFAKTGTRRQSELLGKAARLVAMLGADEA